MKGRFKTTLQDKAGTQIISFSSLVAHIRAFHFLQQNWRGIGHPHNTSDPHVVNLAITSHGSFTWLYSVAYSIKSSWTHVDITNTQALFLRVGCEPHHPDCLPDGGNTFPTGHYFSCAPSVLLVLLISCLRPLFVKCFQTTHGKDLY